MTDTPGGRRWRPRARKIPEPARPAEPAREDGPAAACAMRLAINLLLLRELHQATGRPPASTLQELAIVAAAGPQRPCAG